MRNSIRLIASLAALACATASANAATAIITYKGKVYNSYDQTGFFGVAPGSSLDGLAFTAKYTVTVPTPGAYLYSDSTFQETSGGSLNGNLSPVSGSLTINGVTLSAGSYNGYSNRYDNWSGYYDQIYNIAQNYFYDGQTFIDEAVNNHVYSTYNDLTSTAEITDPTVTFDTSHMYGSGSFWNYHYDYATGIYTTYVYGNFSVESISISAAGVPEPASWALMLAGFGMIGGALRAARRRSAVAA